MHPRLEPVPAVYVDPDEDGLDEEREPLQREPEAEHVAEVLYPHRPQQPQLERQDRSGDHPHREQRQHALRPAPGQSPVQPIPGAQVPPLGEQDQHGEGDAEADQRDVHDQRERLHLARLEQVLLIDHDPSQLLQLVVGNIGVGLTQRYGGAPCTVRSTACPLTCSARVPTASSAPSATARASPASPSRPATTPRATSTRTTPPTGSPRWLPGRSTPWTLPATRARCAPRSARPRPAATSSPRPAGRPPRSASGSRPGPSCCTATTWTTAPPGCSRTASATDSVAA